MLKKCCGADIHQNMILATILDETKQKQTQRFKNNLNEIQQLINWLKQHQCNHVLMESTSIYWVPLYISLEDAKIQANLVNARQVKNIARRKTDQLDSEWLAYLLLTDLVRPSYVPPKPLRELRDLTRQRVKYIQNRTQYKNREHKILNRISINLHTVFSDLFGKASQELVNGLIDGKNIDDILKNTKNRQLKAKSEAIKDAVQGVLSENDIFMLSEMNDLIFQLNEKISRVEARIALLVDKRSVEIVSSVPGIGVSSAAVIVAEIGDPSRFSGEKQVAAWAGLVPSLYQSADRTCLGHISKLGSCHLRRVMVEVAHCAVRCDCRFRRMFNRVSARRGGPTAYVAVARKMLGVVWHLLVCGELYVEEGFSKVAVRVRSGCVDSFSLEDMVVVLRNSGYMVSKG